MTLLHMDGFDHYGTDTTNMTEGIYDQVDAAFSLSNTNPRTGGFALRRDSTTTDSKVIYDLLTNKEIFGSGFSLYMSQMPSNPNSYNILKLLDSSQNVHVTFLCQQDGSVIVKRGDFDGIDIGMSASNVITDGQYNHFEFGIVSDQAAVDSELFFNENFSTGLTQYSVTNSQFFLVQSTSKGESIKITNITDNPETGSATRSNIEPRNYTRCTFYGKVNSNTSSAGLDADIGIFHIRSTSGIVISTILSRDGDIAGSDEELFIQGQPIAGVLSVGEWYFFEYVLDWDTGDLAYTVTGDTQGLFASGNLTFNNSVSISELSFLADVATGEVLNDSANYADIRLFYNSITGNDTGYLEVRVNGVTVISESGLNVSDTSDLGFRFISLEFGGVNADHGVITDVDDFYIWDASGSWNNSFLGDRRCFLLKPNQDTNIADFEPSEGNFGYKMIDDASPDDDGTYIIAEAYLQSGSPLTGTSEFKIEDISSGSSMISGINVITRAAKTDNSSGDIYTSISSGADSLSASSHSLTTSYQYFYDIYEYDPSTISSITRNELNSLSVSVTADNLDFEAVFASPDADGSPDIFGSPTDVVSPEDVVSPTIVEPDIPLDFVARYLFDADFTDESGTYNGTNAGATFLTAGDGPGGTDYGINVGGGSKQVNLPVSLASALGSGAGTISFAIRSAVKTNVAIVLSGSDTGSTNQFFIPEFGNGIELFPRVVSSPAGSASIARGFTAGAINTWHKVIIRTSGSAWSFRLNGSNLSVVVDAGTNNGAWFGDVVSIDNMIIGFLDRSAGDTGAQAFDLAFMTLYDRNLSDSECAQLEAEW